ncbi:MAG: hypothetical protein HY744_28305, partial [Deltaproteobacteria bacterium]|nr:hypothetical protein [Deltaproteobacteria bacterium]
MTREADPAAAPRRVRRRGRGRRRSPRRWAVALALGLVPPALGGAFALWRWRSPGPAAGAPFPAPALAAADALGCIPAGALLVATVDVGAVRRAGLADR